MNMTKIAITTASFGENSRESLGLLQNEGFEIVSNPYKRKMERCEVIELCKNAIGIIAGTEKFDADTLRSLAKLRVISRCGAGLENIDMDVAKRHGVKVFNTPAAPTRAVAELTVALILNLLRKVNQMDGAVRNGKWRDRMGDLLSGKRVGIIGFGRIGRKVAQLLKPFGCDIKYNDPFLKTRIGGFRQLPLKKLLLWADIISVHVSKGKEIIGSREMNLMKKGAWLLNLSRGGVIDEKALYKSLKTGHLSGAALDVFVNEPYDGPLKELDNVILTPHIGSYEMESRVRMEMEAVENLLKGLRNTEAEK